MRRNTSRRAYEAEVAETNNGNATEERSETKSVASVSPHVKEESPATSKPVPTKKDPVLEKRERKQAEKRGEARSERKSIKPRKVARKRSAARNERVAQDEPPNGLALPEVSYPPRYLRPRETAEANSGQPQVLIVQETLIQPNGEPGSTEFYRILVQDRFDTTFSEPLTRNEVIGKSPADIIEMAEGVSDCSRNIVGYAKDRMSGIWLNHEFHAWPSEE